MTDFRDLTDTPGLAAYRDDIRLVIADKRGAALIDWALAEPFVETLIRSLFENGAHAGFAASRVREYIQTRNDLAVARTHAAARGEGA